MIEFKVSDSDLKNIFRRLDKIRPGSHNQVLVGSLRELALRIEAHLKQSLSGSILKVRTGKLRQSIGSKINASSNEINIVVGSGVRTGNRLPYANILETGGKIVPKKAKFLAIPLSGAMTKSGAGKFSAREFFDKYKEKAFIHGNIIYLRKSKTNIVPMFVLKDSVNIPAKKYLSLTLSKIQGEIVNYLLKAIDRRLEENG